jgi:plasmid stability protein
MSSVVIRNLPAETHLALKLRAAQNDRSTEAEIRAILEEAVRPKGRILLGTALASLSRDMGVTSEDFETLTEALRSRPAEPIVFE